jgi:hypothetical protein
MTSCASHQPIHSARPSTVTWCSWVPSRWIGDVRYLSSGGQYLVERSEVPGDPDSIPVVSVDADSDGYAQHYFDSQGVVRAHAMTFAGGVWTLLRVSVDFTPLDFWQRFKAHVQRERRHDQGYVGEAGRRALGARLRPEIHEGKGRRCAEPHISQIGNQPDRDCHEWKWTRGISPSNGTILCSALDQLMEAVRNGSPWLATVLYC